MREKLYRIGIDVGLNSVGLAAIEVDEAGTPICILNMETIIHDGGIEDAKTATTRKAASGVARRTRRLYRQRHWRLTNLDATLRELGWPIIVLERTKGQAIDAPKGSVQAEALRDPRFPWKARLELVSGKIADQKRLHELLSVAIRHIARHRGWRNPYMSVNALVRESVQPSEYFGTLTKSIAAKLNRSADELAGLTVAEIVALAQHLDINERYVEQLNSRTGELTVRTFVDVSRKLRGVEKVGEDGQLRSGLLESKIHQSDNVRELRKIWDVQELPEELFNRIVQKVFQAKSPKGSAKERIGKDALDPTQPRAEKASLAFQRFRVVQIIANLRIKDEPVPRPLTTEERQACFNYLWNEGTGLTTWADVAEQIGITRRELEGTAAETDDHERASAHPPTNVTDARIRETKIKELVAEWDSADEPYREALIEVLGNGSGSGAARELVERATEFIASLPEEVLGSIDSIKLPEGRAAYSLKTMRRLTDHMLNTTDDLSAARKVVFGVADSWKPPADPIGQPVGNPAVDRVLKIVNRYLLACEREWGIPSSVNVEHTRNGLMSEKQARKIDSENNQRYTRNRTIDAEMATYLASRRDDIAAYADDTNDEGPDRAVSGDQRFSRRDISRRRAFTRQEGKCLYCGIDLGYNTFELDHIVPRADQGATNTQVNLAAICRECNHSKGKQPFATWAASGVRPQVSLAQAIERVNGFRFFGVDNAGSDSNPRTYRAQFKREVIDRLKRTDMDDPIDSRSIESVGWMANELHHRIEAHYAELSDGTDQTTRVGVFRGWITSEARKAAGIEDRIILIGGQPGKNRLDRRHHAVDAATIAMIRQGAAQSMTAQEQARKAHEWAESKRIARAEGMEEWDLVHVFAVRDNLRSTNQLDPSADTNWKTYKGANPALFDTWQLQMQTLATLVQDALVTDQVPVFEFLRLKPGTSAGHEDTIRPLNKAHVGDALSVELIDRSATPQQWLALTQHPDFDPVNGLPEDLTRRIRIKNKWFAGSDEIGFFPTSAGCIAVRNGYAELGSSFHHARIYRCTKKLKSGKESIFYAMMRVYQVDLLPYRGCAVDLFSVDIPPQAISRRASEQRLRNALDTGEAEYIGWIVPGDEVQLDMTSQTSGAIGEFLKQFSSITHWRIQALIDQTKLHLRPRSLAGEGASSKKQDKDSSSSKINVSETVEKILSSNGYRPSVDVLFSKCNPVIIRRDMLGWIRIHSKAGLPVSWRIDGTTSDSLEAQNRMNRHG